MFGMRLIARLGGFFGDFSHTSVFDKLHQLVITFSHIYLQKDKVIPEKLIFSVYRILEEVSVVIIICTLC